MDNENKFKNNKLIRRPSFGPGRAGHAMLFEKPKDFKGTLAKLIKYITPYKVKFILVISLSIIATLFTIIGPKMLGNVTNNIVSDYIEIVIYEKIHQALSNTNLSDIPNQPLEVIPNEIKEKIPSQYIDKINNIDLSSKPSIRFERIQNTILLLILIYLISSFANYLQEWIMASITQKISFKLRQESSEKINKLPLRYFDQNAYGDILSRITNDIDLLSQSLSQSTTQFISSIITIIGIAIMMINISLELTIIALLILPFSMILIRFIISKSQNLFKKQQNTLGMINSHIEENFSGHNIIKAFNKQNDSFKYFKTINKDLYESGWKSQFISGILFPIINFMGNISFVGVSIVGGWLAINKGLQIGGIQAFIQYVRQFNIPTVQLGNIANVMQSGVASAERIFEFLEEQEEVKDVINPKSIKKLRGEIEFKNVTFSYEKQQPILKNFNLHINPGQKLAIVGPTGAGKTTIVNLIMRFYDVNEGSITIDGIDIRELKKSDLRKMFGMVLQDTWLFNGTIRDNLKYGNPKASEKEIKDAVKTANIDHLIESLPQGYDMIINEDSDNISYGEKQLITIARAMVTKPPMLILDEATSSIDTRTEIIIQKAIERLLEGRTSIIIAHRLSTIIKSDNIIVVNNGTLAEQGTHRELLERNGLYSKIYQSQFENN